MPDRPTEEVDEPAAQQIHSPATTQPSRGIADRQIPIETRLKMIFEYDADLDVYLLPDEYDFRGIIYTMQSVFGYELSCWYEDTEEACFSQNGEHIWLMSNKSGLYRGLRIAKDKNMQASDYEFGEQLDWLGVLNKVKGLKRDCARVLYVGSHKDNVPESVFENVTHIDLFHLDEFSEIKGEKIRGDITKHDFKGRKFDVVIFRNGLTILPQDNLMDRISLILDDDGIILNSADELPVDSTDKIKLQALGFMSQAESVIEDSGKFKRDTNIVGLPSNSRIYKKIA